MLYLYAEYLNINRSDRGKVHASEDKGLISVKCGSEQLFLSVPPEHPFAYYKEVHFAEMNGESFLMASEVGFWSDIVRNHMPASHFLLQNGTEELSEVVRTSSLPSFVTDISKKYMKEADLQTRRRHLRNTVRERQSEEDLQFTEQMQV